MVESKLIEIQIKPTQLLLKGMSLSLGFGLQQGVKKRC